MNIETQNPPELNNRSKKLNIGPVMRFTCKLSAKTLMIVSQIDFSISLSECSVFRYVYRDCVVCFT